jgi:aminoglycoside 6-adenylyltransferase
LRGGSRVRSVLSEERIVVIASHDPREVIRCLTRWAERRDQVRTMVLTSTRANPSAPVDVLSDFDVVLVVEDVRPYFEDRSWLYDFGEVLVAYRDPIYPDPDYGIEQTGNVVQYADGLKIDFSLWPVALLRRIVRATVLPDELDVGYTVLLDKDCLTAGMRPPSYEAYVPERPDEETYLRVVNNFFSDAPYVAKYLWRDELLPAKWCLEVEMRHHYLRPMLEWRMERDYGWSEPTGNLGKGLEKRLPTGIREELEGTYAGAGTADNWEALFRTMALFRRVATVVAADLGHVYPLDLDRRVTAYVREIRDLDHAEIVKREQERR